MTKARKLQAKAAALPEHLASEVLDFLELLTKNRSRQHHVSAGTVDRLRGAFKGKLSTASEFALQKADEIRLES